MPESSHNWLDGQAELGALQVLLQGADVAFLSVEATWRVWRHEERLRQAFVADADAGADMPGPADPLCDGCASVGVGAATTRWAS